MKKIAQIVCVYPPYRGGIGKSAKDFTKILQKKYKIDTFTPLYKNLKRKEKNVYYLKTPLKYGNGAVLFSLFWKLKKYDFIFLHYPFYGTSELITLYSLLFKKKQSLIIYYHMDTPNLSLLANILSLPAKLLFKYLFKKSDYILCSSFDYIKNSQIKKYYFKERKKFKAVPFGVNTDEFKPVLAKKNKKKRILFVGGLDKAHNFKGLNNLLRAVAKLKNKNWLLEIVGNGNLKKNYINKSKELKINKQTIFYGNVSTEKLKKIYQKADFFVLPSIHQGEAFGIVLLEAMSSGLPVIASNLPGVRSVFENKKNGYLVKPNNIEDLKTKINIMLNNKKIRQKMSQEARKHIVKNYNIQKTNNLLLNIFNLF